MTKETVYEIKKVRAAVGHGFNRKGVRNSTFTNRYELYADGEYVKTFDLLRELKRAVELYKGGKEIFFPFLNMGGK